jgi:hypothetical protein
VVITQSENSTDVIEGAEGDTFGASDTYTVTLTRVPSADVYVTVTPDAQIVLDKEDPLEPGEPITLHFTAPTDTEPGNWMNSQTVTVRASQDSVPEGFHHGYITHSVTSEDTDIIEVKIDSFTLAEEGQTSVLLRNYPLSDQPVSVMLDGEALDSERFELSSSTIIFLDEDGRPEPLTGEVEVEYSYLIPGYDGVEVERVVANIGDKDTPGVLITESDGSTNVIECVQGLLLSPDQKEIQYDQSLTQYNNVYYNKVLNFDFDVSDLEPAGAGVLTVSAIADLDWSSEYLRLEADGGFLENLFTAGGKQYSPVTTDVNLNADKLQALAADDGTITFTVTPSWAVNDFSWWYRTSSKLTLELSFPASLDTVAEFPIEDTYTVVLTKEPDADVTINVTPQPTRTTRGPLVTLTEQVEVSDTTFTFTPGNWNVPQTVTVSAKDDWIADGGDTKVFAPTPHTVNDIKGPLFIDGVGGEGSLAGLTPPVLLPADPSDPADLAETNKKASTGEVVSATELTLTVNTADVEPYGSLQYRTVEITEGPEVGVGQFRLILSYEENIDGTTTLTLNDPWDLEPDELDEISKYAITNESLNFFVEEEEQVDFLTVFHEDSVAFNTGELKDAETDGYDKNISGLGMGPGLTLRGVDYPGGITYGNLEVVEINLGSGNDEFFVYDTHSREDGFRTWTMLNTGPGDDDVTVSLDAETDGLFALNTQEGDDNVDASDSTLPLVIFGWDGNDAITGGQGNDIIFGDRGRVDYLKEGTPEVVTRLGATPEPITGNVTGADAATLTVEGEPFPTADDGLRGSIVWNKDGTGTGQ